MTNVIEMSALILAQKRAFLKDLYKQSVRIFRLMVILTGILQSNGKLTLNFIDSGSLVLIRTSQPGGIEQPVQFFIGKDSS